MWLSGDDSVDGINDCVKWLSGKEILLLLILLLLAYVEYSFETLFSLLLSSFISLLFPSLLNETLNLEVDKFLLFLFIIFSDLLLLVITFYI